MEELNLYFLLETSTKTKSKGFIAIGSC